MASGRVRIRVAGVSVYFNGSPALDGATLDVREGEWVGLIGPNGAGKTTLLRVIGAYLRASRGQVLLEGRPVTALPARERARVLAAMGADPPLEFGFTAGEYVMLARIPHTSGWWEGEDDRRAVEEALRATGAAGLAARRLEHLSAGERQRVHLARALAQQPRVLLLDEPTAHLDLRYQVEAMRLLERLCRQGVTMISALHDVNLAALFCHRLVLMASGRILAAGPPGQVLREDLLREAYGCAVRVVPHPGTGVPQVLPEP